MSGQLARQTRNGASRFWNLVHQGQQGKRVVVFVDIDQTLWNDRAGIVNTLAGMLVKSSLDFEPEYANALGEAFLNHADEIRESWTQTAPPGAPAVPYLLNNAHVGTAEILALEPPFPEYLNSTHHYFRAGAEQLLVCSQGMRLAALTRAFQELNIHIPDTLHDLAREFPKERWQKDNWLLEDGALELLLALNLPNVTVIVNTNGLPITQYRKLHALIAEGVNVHSSDGDEASFLRRALGPENARVSGVSGYAKPHPLSFTGDGNLPLNDKVASADVIIMIGDNEMRDGLGVLRYAMSSGRDLSNVLYQFYAPRKNEMKRGESIPDDVWSKLLGVTEMTKSHWETLDSGLMAPPNALIPVGSVIAGA